MTETAILGCILDAFSDSVGEGFLCKSGEVKG